MNSEFKLARTYLWTVVRNWWLILVVGVLLLSGPVERLARVSLGVPLWAKLVIGIGTLGLAQYLAYREQVKLKEAALASTAAKQPKKNEASVTTLLKEGDTLINRLENAQSAVEVKKWAPLQLAWKEQVIEALNRAKVHSEAVAFSHATDDSKGSALWTHSHVPGWKRPQWVEFMLYRDKLHEIVERNKL